MQALGAQSEIYPVGCRFEPRRNDILLLCSDGLSNKLYPEDLFEIVINSKNDLTAACNELVREANARGGEDNITVILARFKGDDLPAAESGTVKVERLTFEEN